MTEKDFLVELVELMDTEAELTMDTKLDGVDEWDSLSHIAFMAFAAQQTERKVLPTEVKAAVKVSDLYALISEGV